jgi:hypothetical protein
MEYNRYLVIDSADRIQSTAADYDTAYTGTDTAYFKCRFFQTVDIDGKDLKLVSASLSNTVYVINGHNNTFQFSEPTGPATPTATLTQGYYTPTQLATEIGTQMTAVTAVAATYTGTYGQTTKKIVITNAVADPAFSILWSTGTQASLQNKLWKQLGFTSADGTAPADSTGVLGGGFYTCTPRYHVHLNYWDNMFITIWLDGYPLRSTYVAGRGDSPTMVVPVAVPPDNQFAISGNDFRYRLTTKHPRVRDVVVRIADENDTVLDLNNSPNKFVFKIVDKK